MPLVRVWCAAFIAFVIGTLPLGASASSATPPPDAPPTAWLYRGSDVPPDPDWHFGTLPNGVRYAVRHSSVPGGQVSIRLRMDVGSLMERDSERGFAHFIEHLSFRGSAHVPDGESKRIWQRFGATFGSDSNADTSFTNTVFRLDLPGNPDDPASIADHLDASLHILEGMAESPTLTQAALDAERPVVLAEERETPGPQARLDRASMALMLAGQPIANRDPIGTRETLDAATAASVQAFHDRWYRPERAVVIVAGDLDPAVLERLVVQNFSGWRGVGPAPATPDFGKPGNAPPLTSVLVDSALPTQVTLTIARPWTVFQDTIIFNRKRLVDLLAMRILNRRLETRAREGAPFLLASASLDDVARSANVTQVQIQPAGARWDAALRDVRRVIAGLAAHPPTQAEIDREIEGIDAGMRQDVATWSTKSTSDFTDELAQAVDINETVTTAANSYEILHGAETQHMFTPAAIQASARRLFSGTTRALLVTHAIEPGSAMRLTAALAAPVGSEGGEAERSVRFDQLPLPGPPGGVTRRVVLLGDPLRTEQIEFANGVRLLLHSSTAEANKLFVRVRFGGGYNSLPSDRVTPAWATGPALVASGEGGMGQEQLDELANDRQIGFDVSIGSDAFVFDAQTTSADLADQLRAFAVKLASPGWDPRPVERARAAMLAQYDGIAASPDGVLGRDLEQLLHAGDPRWATPTRADLAATTPAAFRALWEPLLRQGPLEVDIFGDVDSDAAIKAVAQTLGALPPRTAPPSPPPPVRFPAHRDTVLTLTHTGQPDQAAAAIAWPTGSGTDDIRESRKLEVLAAVFRDRLLDQLRSEAGLSYSPEVDSDWPFGLPGGGRIVAIGLVPAGKTDVFFRLARSIAADLAAHPVGEDEFKRSIEPLTQQLTRRSSSNLFWQRVISGGAFDPKRVLALPTVLSDIASTTPAEVQALAAKYLRPDTDFAVEVVPAKAAETSTH